MSDPDPMPLSQLIPEPDFAEHHQLQIPATAERAMAALRKVTFREVRTVRPLMAVRSIPARLSGGQRLALPTDQSFLDSFATGFALLDATPRGLVYAGLHQPHRLRGASVKVPSVAMYQAFHEPGYCRIGTDFRITERSGGVLLSTQTLVGCTDPATRRAFRRYWMLIRPFSGLIRWDILLAVRRRATAGRVSR